MGKLLLVGLHPSPSTVGKPMRGQRQLRVRPATVVRTPWLNPRQRECPGPCC